VVVYVRLAGFQPLSVPAIVLERVCIKLLVIDRISAVIFVIQEVKFLSPLCLASMSSLAAWFGFARMPSSKMSHGRFRSK
jgi:hypothetical protein